MAKKGAGKRDIFATRIPKCYFMSTGVGDTDLGHGIDPWETGAYDLALLEAQIENFNVLQYTSVIPPEAKEIPIEKAKKFFHHGAALEVIMANINGHQGDHLCAGVGRIHVRRKSDGKVIGGFAAEYEGHAKAAAARKVLHESLMGIFSRRYKSDEYEYFDEKFTIRDCVIKNKWGTVIALMGFVTYIFPEVGKEK